MKTLILLVISAFFFPMKDIMTNTVSLGYFLIAVLLIAVFAGIKLWGEKGEAPPGKYLFLLLTGAFLFGGIFFGYIVTMLDYPLIIEWAIAFIGYCVLASIFFLLSTIFLGTGFKKGV